MNESLVDYAWFIGLNAVSVICALCILWRCCDHARRIAFCAIELVFFVSIMMVVHFVKTGAGGQRMFIDGAQYFFTPTQLEAFLNATRAREFFRTDL